MKTVLKIIALALIILLPTMCGAGSKLSSTEAQKLILDHRYNGTNSIWIIVDTNDGAKSAEVLKFLLNNNYISATTKIQDRNAFGPLNKFYYVYEITQKGKDFIKGNYDTLTLNGKIYKGEDAIMAVEMPGDRYFHMDQIRCKSKVNIKIDEILHRDGIAECKYSVTLSDDNPVLANFPKITKFVTTGTQSAIFVKYDEGWKIR